MKNLANQFRKFDWDDEVAVFSRDYLENRTQFMLNELLFDITVAQIRAIDSARGQRILAITGAKWLIESEFKLNNSRSIMVDLNKLLIGKSENKLLVISAQSSMVDWVKKTISSINNDSSSKFYLATIPHPKGWYSSDIPSIAIYQLMATGNWVKINYE